MANIIIFDKLNNKIKQFLKSVNTPDFEGRDDVIINPDISSFENIPIKYWKHSNGFIVEMSQAEKDTVDQEIINQEDLNLRNSAKSPIDELSETGLIFRAFADIIKDEINILRSLHGLPERTLNQLKTAIKNRIDSKLVD